MSDTNINNMDFKQLRNEVQLLRDELAIMKRKYDDILYNLDDENFSNRLVKEKGDLKSAIEITEEQIKSMVTDEEFESAISQTARQIQSIVSKNISAKFVSNIHPNNRTTTDEQKSMLCQYDGNLYYYNDITETWKYYPYRNGLRSQFVQTPSGFELTGDVSITGDAVVGGTITGAALINSDGTTILRLGDNGSNYGDLKLIRINTSGTETEIFKVYDNQTVINLYAFETSFLYSSGANTYPQGTWNFTNANVINIRPKFA